MSVVSETWKDTHVANEAWAIRGGGEWEIKLVQFCPNWDRCCLILVQCWFNLLVYLFDVGSMLSELGQVLFDVGSSFGSSCSYSCLILIQCCPNWDRCCLIYEFASILLRIVVLFMLLVQFAHLCV